jgi:Uma2 family endonuclease
MNADWPQFSELRRFTVAEYHRLNELGILKPDTRIELIEGHLIEMPSGWPGVAARMNVFEGAMAGLLPDAWFIRRLRAVTLAESPPESEPKPDFAIVRGPRDLYSAGHPVAADVGIVIEIEGCYPPLERVGMARIYARAGIPVYWVVNPAEHTIEVYTQPSGSIDSPHYSKRETYPVGTAVPVVLDGNTVGTIAVADVIPRVLARGGVP